MYSRARALARAAGVAVALVVVAAQAAGAQSAPPDLVATGPGEIRVRVKRGDASATHRIELRVDRAATGPGWDETRDLGALSGTVTEIATDLSVVAGDKLDVIVDVDFGGGTLEISYVAGRAAAPGEPSPRVIAPRVTLLGRRVCGTGLNVLDLTSFYASAQSLMSLSCWEDHSDWDYNDFGLSVDFVPDPEPTQTPSPTAQPTAQPSATRTATQTATRTATQTATRTATRTPSSTLTPRPSVTPSPTRTSTPAISPTPGMTPGVPSCICQEVRDWVPRVVIDDALANPERFNGWGLPRDEGKPVSPANPLRECLSLQNVSVPRYHPIWNKPIWRHGCP